MFRFAHSEYLNGLYLVPVLILLFVWMILWKKRTIKKLGEFSRVRKLLPDGSTAKLWIRFFIFIIGFIILVIGIADPQIGSRLQEVKHEGVDIIIALDISNSMKAEDIKPNRLDRSKQAISRLIDKLQGDRIGVIVFAGKAYVQLPITTDYGAAKLFLSTISTDLIPTQGTAIGAAIELAQNSFPKEPGTSKSLIVITDGENHEDNAIELAKQVAKEGIVIHTIGMGSAEGAPIPIFRNNVRAGYFKDKEGNTVLTKLDEQQLKQIASAGKGIYIRASNSSDGFDSIIGEINKLQKKTYGTKIYTDYEDRFQYFLAAAFLLFILELLISERKNKWFSTLNIFGEKK